MTPTDPQQCRDLALEKRILASRMKDPLAKAALIRLAKHYENWQNNPKGQLARCLNGCGLSLPSQTPYLSPPTHNNSLTSISVC